MRVWRHFRAVLLAPVLMAVVVPLAIWLTAGLRQVEVPAAGRWLALAVGGALVSAGVALFLWTNVLFDREGKGTLAIFDPPRRLVVRGPYRHVRNPMITSVIAVLFGEAVMTRSSWLMLWSLTFLGVNMLFMPLFEEPGLVRRFGEDYMRYRANVPRWLPRVRPWSGPSD